MIRPEDYLGYALTTTETPRYSTNITVTDFNESQTVQSPTNHQAPEQAVSKQSVKSLEKQKELIIDHYQRNEFDSVIKLLEAIRDSDDPIWSQAWCPDWQHLLAGCYVNAGLAHTVAQETAQAYQQAIKLLQAIRDHGDPDWQQAWCIDYQHALAHSYYNLAIVLPSPEEKVQAYKQAIALLKAIRDHNDPSWCVDWQYHLIRYYTNLSKTPISRQEKTQACQQCIQLLEAIRDHDNPTWHQTWCADWQYKLSQYYLNLGLHHPSSDEQIQDFQQTIKLLEAIKNHTDQAWHQAWCAKWQHTLASSYSNLAIVLSSPEEKVQAYQQAIALLEAIRDHDDPAWYQVWCTEWQGLLAQSYYNFGVSIPRLQVEIQIYQQAIALLEAIRDHDTPTWSNAWCTDWQHILGLSYMNLGFAIFNISLDESQVSNANTARKHFSRAIKLVAPLPPAKAHSLTLSTAHIGLAFCHYLRIATDLAWRELVQAEAHLTALPALDPEVEHQRIQLFNQCFQLHNCIPGFPDWLKTRSRQMLDTLEDIPLPDTDPEGIWHPVYIEFQSFHRHWADYAWRKGDFVVIPEILSACQGWQQGQNSLTRQLQAPSDNLPESVTRFQNLRESLQSLRQQLNQLPVPVDQHPDWPALYEQERALYQQLCLAKASLADEPSATMAFRALGSPLTLTELQAQLKPDEALVLVLDLVVSNQQASHNQGLLLITASQCQGLGIELDPVVEAMLRLRVTLDGTVRYRKGPELSPRPQTQSLSLSQEDSIQEQSFAALTLAERSSFWSQQSQNMTTQFWQPLQAALQAMTGEPIKHLSLIPHGDLQMIPFTLGLPGTLQLYRYPGLHSFHQSRIQQRSSGQMSTAVSNHGSMRSTDSHPVSSGKPLQIGLCCYAGQGRDKLTQADQEKLTLSQFWQQHQAAVIDLALNEPGMAVIPPADYDILHFACHGGKDPATGLPALVVNKQSNLTPYSFLKTQATLKHVIYNACIAGTLFEPISGEPSGLVSAAFQVGAHSVIAALTEIPDQGADRMAVLIHQNLAQGLSPNQALRQAQAEITFAPTITLESLQQAFALALRSYQTNKPSPDHKTESDPAASKSAITTSKNPLKSILPRYRKQSITQPDASVDKPTFERPNLHELTKFIELLENQGLGPEHIEQLNTLWQSTDTNTQDPPIWLKTCHDLIKQNRQQSTQFDLGLLLYGYVCFGGE